MIPKATGLCDEKTSMVYLFFIQIDEISIFWLTTDNFHFRILFSGALMFLFFFLFVFFLIISDCSNSDTAGEFRESCEVTQCSTFLRRNSKGLWERKKKKNFL